jgi:hypothetical protein
MAVDEKICLWYKGESDLNYLKMIYLSDNIGKSDLKTIFCNLKPILEYIKKSAGNKYEVSSGL